jgi:hypothetical protein
LTTYARSLLRLDIPVILAGDFNVAPTGMDIYPTKSWDDDALIHPASRAAYAKLVKQGWTDALRKMHPDERIYTFWHYMRNRFARDAGLRFDHFLLSPQIAGCNDKSSLETCRSRLGRQAEPALGAACLVYRSFASPRPSYDTGCRNDVESCPIPETGPPGEHGTNRDDPSNR